MFPILKTRLVRSALAVVLVSSGLWAPALEAVSPPGAGPPPGTPGPFPASLTVAVDCDAGDTVAEALARRADELRVEVTGTCVEDVEIRRDRTTLVGVAPGAEIVGSPSPAIPFGGGVTVLGASRVTLADLTIRLGRRGVAILDGGAARLERLTVRDQDRDGVLLQGGSQAWIEDCALLDNAFYGLAVWDGSSVMLGFDGTTVASGNGQVGVLVSNGSDVTGFATTRLEADDNQYGVFAQLNGSVQAVGLSAARNDFGAVAMLGGVIGTALEVRDSAIIGVLATNGGQVDVGGSIEGSGVFGIRANHDATVALRGAALSGNSVGMLLDGTEALFVDSTVSDPVELVFGTRVDFRGGNSFTGGVSCDATVLVRGDVACPPAPASLETAGVGKRSALREAGGAALGLPAPFPLEP